MIDDCYAILLAGGESQRMGCDKTALRLGGKTLLDRAAQSLQGVFGEVRVSVRALRPDLAWPQVCDVAGVNGPLAGLLAGLQAAQRPWVFAQAADMPFLAPALIRAMAAVRTDALQAVVPRVAGVVQPLAAFYATGALPVWQQLQREAGAHSPGPRAVLARLAVLYVDAEHLPGSRPESFMDVDDPEAWARACAIAGR